MTDAPILLVIGSLNMDLVVRVKRQPRPGDTVLGDDLETHPGGKGANQAAAAAKAGARVAMLGKVGNDAYGNQLKTALERAGVDTSLLEKHDGPSGVALITVDEGGENMIVVSSGANRHVDVRALEPRIFDGVSLVLMQLEIPRETVSKAAELAQDRGIPVMLNAAPAQDLPEALVTHLSYLIVNEGEAEVLSGQTVKDRETAREAARALAEKVGTAIVTLGPDGLVWQQGNDGGHLAAYEVEVVDTTAAGDAFCGALAAQLAQGAALEHALGFANAAGALATTREGAQPSLPGKTEIERCLKRAAS